MPQTGIIKRARVPKTATATHAAATVTTETPKNGQSVFITGIRLSYSVAQTTAPLATLTDGTTTLGNWHVYNSRDISDAIPFQVTPGKAAVVNLPDGGSAVVGAVTVEYYIG